MGAKCCLCILQAAWSSQLFAAELLRGPYLQLGTPASVTVKWRTDVPTDSLVRYGFDASDPGDLAIGYELTSEHEVTLADLAPDTKYFYSVGSTGQMLAGGEPVFHFRTFPMPGRPRPTRIWAIG